METGNSAATHTHLCRCRAHQPAHLHPRAPGRHHPSGVPTARRLPGLRCPRLPASTVQVEAQRHGHRLCPEPPLPAGRGQPAHQPAPRGQRRGHLPVLGLQPAGHSSEPQGHAPVCLHRGLQGQGPWHRVRPRGAGRGAVLRASPPRWRPFLRLDLQRQPAARPGGQPQVCVPGDGEPVHRQDGAVGRGQLHLLRHQRRGPEERAEPAHAPGAAHGRCDGGVRTEDRGASSGDERGGQGVLREAGVLRPGKEDEGAYECLAGNLRGRNLARGQLVFYAPPEWEQKIQNTYLSVYDSLLWECRASGQPSPGYVWLKDGERLEPEERIQIENGTLSIAMLNVSDSGVYQCAAENKHQSIYANAELRVLASAPDFSRNPVKPVSVVQVGGDVVVECRPSAFPRASVSWRRGAEALRPGGRTFLSEEGSLRIQNVTRSDAGPYTCVAANQFGVAQSSGTLMVKERTLITLPPSSMDVMVGESIVLPCQVSRDPSVHVTFEWTFNGEQLRLQRGAAHFERVGGDAVGDLMVRNIQLPHSGTYVCAVRSPLESLSAAADVIVRGPPGPPEAVTVGGISSTTAELSWTPGPSNNSPIQIFIVQARTPFSVGWLAVPTVPEILGGSTHKATVAGLSPWVDYEFRVLAGNSIGIGEPSQPSALLRTKAAVPAVAPAGVGGGGGSRSELVITWEPIPEELQNGAGFGYTVMFRPVGSAAWAVERQPSVDASRLVYRNESLSPLSPFEVKVGVYNQEGDGPWSTVCIVYSGEDEPRLAPRGTSVQSVSASEMEVSWEAVSWNRNTGRVLGYEILYWTEDSRGSVMGRTRVSGNITSRNVTGLRANTLYFAAVRAYNTAGPGPSSAPVNVTTKKSPPSQPPANIAWKLTNSKLCLNWEHVRTMENESAVLGYKILYRQNRQSKAHILETNNTSAELLVPVEQDYLVEIRTVSAGGDGSSSEEIRIPRMSSLSSRGPVLAPSAHFLAALDVFYLFAIQPLVR
ncbi:contactin-6 isoform X2 [Sorex araneus]|uniref:contactin-6 isoform X2 n=1 Tax=Sorex araneus TaxID=42254 RepID=UPI00243375E4|nr:contactin-6 isoform X2 [Sorex araneus]